MFVSFVTSTISSLWSIPFVLDQPTQGPATPAVWLWSETLRDVNAGSIVLPYPWWLLVAGMAARDGRAELQDARCSLLCSL